MEAYEASWFFSWLCPHLCISTATMPILCKLPTQTTLFCVARSAHHHHHHHHCNHTSPPQVLQLQEQLQAANADNALLRRQLEQQKALNEQMQQAMLDQEPESVDVTESVVEGAGAGRAQQDSFGAFQGMDGGGSAAAHASARGAESVDGGPGVDGVGGDAAAAFVSTRVWDPTRPFQAGVDGGASVDGGLRGAPLDASFSAGAGSFSACLPPHAASFPAGPSPHAASYLAGHAPHAASFSAAPRSANPFDSPRDNQAGYSDHASVAQAAMQGSGTAVHSSGYGAMPPPQAPPPPSWMMLSPSQQQVGGPTHEWPVA